MKWSHDNYPHIRINPHVQSIRLEKKRRSMGELMAWMFLGGISCYLFYIILLAAKYHP